MNKIPVVSFVGKSDSGKTTLLEKVIKELKSKGIRLAIIKHDAHSFDIDKPGKDTWRHAQAGADIVAISSPAKMSIIEKVDKELTLDEVIAKISNVDIILTEGFKRENKPKIEVFRSAAHKTLLCTSDELLAIASDIPWDIGVPCHHLDDYKEITDVLLNYIRDFKS